MNEQIKKLKQKIGELFIDIDILKEAQNQTSLPCRGRSTSEARVSRLLDAQHLQGASHGSVSGEWHMGQPSARATDRQEPGSADQVIDHGVSDLWLWLVWALLRKEGTRVNRKRVYRILNAQPMARLRAGGSAAASSAEATECRYGKQRAMDLMHINCGRDAWAHLPGVIDCHDRELVGCEFALRG